MVCWLWVFLVWGQVIEQIFELLYLRCTNYVYMMSIARGLLSTIAYFQSQARDVKQYVYCTVLCPIKLYPNVLVVNIDDKCFFETGLRNLSNEQCYWHFLSVVHIILHCRLKHTCTAGIVWLGHGKLHQCVILMDSHVVHHQLGIVAIHNMSPVHCKV